MYPIPFLFRVASKGIDFSALLDGACAWLSKPSAALENAKYRQDNGGSAGMGPRRCEVGHDKHKLRLLSLSGYSPTSLV